ncbi:MAG: histidine phosphatase family protein [Pseudomonadales bacterium]|nr:histidine phosphatase family protein [Pseudomonadales bacterium]
MELILIRHGLPEERYSEDGSPADPPLSTTGFEQAQKLADWMQATQIDRLYSSPMQRALQTAQPLAESKAIEIEVCEGVAEFDKKSRGYIPVEQLKERDYEAWVRLMNGQVGSHFPVFAKTVCDSLDEIVAENRGRRVAVTCHGGVINVWAAHVIGFEPKMFFGPNYTSINVFRASSAGKKSIVTLNEFVHLR